MSDEMVANELQKEQKKSKLNWETECYLLGCKTAKDEALKRLTELDDHLFCERPVGYESKGFAWRTIITRFGELKVKRRYYRTSDGNYHFLLDEYLGLPAKELCPIPSLKASILELAAKADHREASRIIASLTAGVLSYVAVHRLIQRTMKVALDEEKMANERCFEEGADPETGGKKVDYLFIEADGCHIKLQQEKQKSYELKCAVAYEGWERLPQQDERYALKEKRVYCHGQKNMEFWEGASLKFDQKWDLNQIGQVVIGGDGANWIDKGVEYFANAILQRDGFHLSRACGRAFGKDAGREIFLLLRNGMYADALEMMEETEPRDTKQAKRDIEYLKNQAEKAADWRTEVSKFKLPPEARRGMGTMESQINKHVVKRMKNRGMSWTINSALKMVKLIELVTNGEDLRTFCSRRNASLKRLKKDSASSDKYTNNEDSLDWFQAEMPIFQGKMGSDPNIVQLRQLSFSGSPIK